MSEYVPQVGDRVRMNHWEKGHFVDIIAIDGDDIFGRWHTGEPSTWLLHAPVAPWTKVPTFPERWINVYEGMRSFESWTAIIHRTRADADKDSSAHRHRGGSDRIGVIHLHPDGTLTMEQP